MKTLIRFSDDEPWGDIVWRAFRYFTAAILVYKCFVMNNLSDTVAQDPMVMWIAIGVALLLVRPGGIDG